MIIKKYNLLLLIILFFIPAHVMGVVEGIAWRVKKRVRQTKKSLVLPLESDRVKKITKKEKKTPGFKLCKLDDSDPKLDKLIYGMHFGNRLVEEISKHSHRCSEVERYIKLGANINVCDSLGNTFLHLAVKCKCRKCVILLTNSGIDASVVNSCDDTPLHVLARLENSNRFSVMIAALLVACGANVIARNDDGFTPADLAKESNSNSELENYLMHEEFLVVFEDNVNDFSYYQESLAVAYELRRIKRQISEKININI